MVKKLKQILPLTKSGVMSNSPGPCFLEQRLSIRISKLIKENKKFNLVVETP